MGKIADLQGDIDEIRDEESVERELRYADAMTDKTENMDKHAPVIYSRPPKEWIMTKTEKRQLHEDVMEHVKELEEEGGEVEIGQKRAPKTAGPRAPEDPKERFVRKLKEKHKQQKVDHKAERLKDEKRIRSIAKRKRQDLKPVKGKYAAVHEETRTQKKRKREKAAKQQGKKRKS